MEIINDRGKEQFEDLSNIMIDKDNCLCSTKRAMRFFMNVGDLQNLCNETDRQYSKIYGKPEFCEKITFAYGILLSEPCTLSRFVRTGSWWQDYYHVYINDCPICGRHLRDEPKFYKYDELSERDKNIVLGFDSITD